MGWGLFIISRGNRTADLFCSTSTRMGNSSVCHWDYQSTEISSLGLNNPKHEGAQRASRRRISQNSWKISFVRLCAYLFAFVVKAVIIKNWLRADLFNLSEVAMINIILVFLPFFILYEVLKFKRLALGLSKYRNIVIRLKQP
jgi:hypothetical protein